MSNFEHILTLFGESNEYFHVDPVTIFNLYYSLMQWISFAGVHKVILCPVAVCGTRCACFCFVVYFTGKIMVWNNYGTLYTEYDIIEEKIHSNTEQN